MKKNLMTLCFSILFLFGCGPEAPSERKESPVRVELFETPSPYNSLVTISKVRVTAVSETAYVSVKNVTVNKGNCIRPRNDPFVYKILGYGQFIQGMYFANKGGDCKVLLVEVDTDHGAWAFNF
ncbi:hypothetical protein [Budvicia aquatica]|uniref:Lipoprotein n=1 Tax=Budvicia aquatica TaxID=82979 RepID=A0A484ZIU2_9GAMM|nr:hypothetical protein [Budvicia aquatica]VFS47333.1 Uncharacterised protein [Budvicia aquatica]